MDLNLRNQTALVTASSGGIGLEIARALAAEGARVITSGTDANRQFTEIHPGCVSET